MEYCVVTGMSISGLTNSVNDHLKSGWELQGGIHFVGQTYAQAMILKPPQDRKGS
jgi:hypothetical protein